MALLNVPIYQVSVRQTYLGKNVYNVLHYIQDNGNPEVATSLVDPGFLELFASAWESTFIPLQNAALTLYSYTLRVAYNVRCTRIEGPPVKFRNRLLFDRELIVTPDSIVGTVTGDPVNSFTAAHGYKQTLQFGRKFKGSLHICGLTESQITGQVLGTTPAVSFNNAFATFLPATFSPIVTGTTFDFIPCVFSTVRQLSPVTTDRGITAEDAAGVIAGLFNSRLGSMTRRKIRAV